MVEAYRCCFGNIVEILLNSAAVVVVRKVVQGKNGDHGDRDKANGNPLS
jgi:hypothetical protein